MKRRSDPTDLRKSIRTCNPDCRVLVTAYHRNGVNGVPFHVVLFREGPRPASPKLAIVFPEPGHVAVLEVAGVTTGDIAFGSNSWRGDCYEASLRNALKRGDEAPCTMTTPKHASDTHEVECLAPVQELLDALRECVRLLADFEGATGEEGEAYARGVALLQRCE